MPQEEKTELQKIEDNRMAHVADAMRAALPEELKGHAALDAALVDLAKVAIAAGDRFPTEGYPFNCNLNTPPADMHPSLLSSFQEIDAGMFSGDSFFGTENHLYCAAFVQRWSKELRLHRETVPEPEEELDCDDELQDPEV